MLASHEMISVVVLAVGFVLLLSGVWISVTLAAVALITLVVLGEVPLLKSVGTSLWSGSASWTLAALPLYIWMGEILFRTNLSKDLFAAIAPWLSRVPGRLLHANVIGCGIFAAVSGSSAATAATIGSVSLPELSKRGYPDSMSVGSLAGAGTLGLLIPPSIVMIVYGVAAEVSIMRLFVAGVIPGLMLMALFSAYIGLWALVNPSRMPARDAPIPLAQKLRQTVRVLPVVILIAGIIGSIYSGIATATEAAAVGVVGALLLSQWSGTMNAHTFRESLFGAMRLSGMIGFILSCSSLLTTAMAYTGAPAAFAEWVSSLHLSPYALIAALCLLYVILGCVIDGLSMIVLTTSVILPAVQVAGFDLLWFGIFIVLVVEMAQITPPVGFNLFVLQALTKKDIFEISLNCMPFFVVMVIAVIAITIFPDIVTWLPSRMIS